PKPDAAAAAPKAAQAEPSKAVQAEAPKAVQAEAPKAVQAEAKVVADSTPVPPAAPVAPAAPAAPLSPVDLPPDPGTPAAPPPAAREPASTRAASRLRRLFAVVGTILVLFVAWEVLTYYVAYTDDAYVRSDLIGVAPEVTGPITGLYVVDNQAIKKGDKIY